MAFEVVAPFTKLLKEPPPAAEQMLRPLFAPTLLEDAKEKKGDFVKVIFTPDGGVAETGWVLATDVKDTGGDVPLPDVDTAGFVRECYIADRRFAKNPEALNEAKSIVPWVVSAEFLIARALIETDIKNSGPKIAGSDGVGPLQVTSKEWTRFLSDGGALATDLKLTEGDRKDSTLQIGGAAWSMHLDVKAIGEARAAKGVGTKEAPVLPTYLEAFFAYLTSPEIAMAISDAKDKTPTIDTLLGALEPKTVEGLFAPPRSDFFGAKGQPKTIEAFTSAVETALAKAFEKVLELTKEHAPEEIPPEPVAGVVTVQGVPDDVALVPKGNAPAFAAFGQNTKVNECFWPLITSHAQAMVVSYTTTKGEVVGAPGRRFFADRRDGARHHVGMDIYCNEGDVVIACAPGEVVSYYKFYKTSTGEQSYALFVAHDGVVINYGEVKANADQEFGWKINGKVTAGQKIAKVSSTKMIHFETYVPGTVANSKWLNNGPRPASLLNPTMLLLTLAAGATRIDTKGNKVAGAGSAVFAQGGAGGGGGGQPVKINDDDLITLARTLYGEARNQQPEGRQAVAAVILNRARLNKPSFGGSKIASVCKQSRQFSCWNDEDPNMPIIRSMNPGANKIFDACVATAQQVMGGQLGDNTGQATHYFNPKGVKKTPDWAAPPAQKTVTIGAHIFFKNVK